jgi:predicted kinase
MKRQLVLMSGYPASGKSTLGAALAAELGWPLICKDALLAVIFDALGGTGGDAALSLRSGQAAWAVFWFMAGTHPHAVLDTNIEPRNAEQRAKLEALGAQIVEVHCDCPAEVAIARYAARAQGDRPAQRTATLTPDRIAKYDGPVGLGRLIRVDTAKTVDVSVVAAEVRAALGVQ